VEMTVESATLRVRPLVMTVGMNIVGLVPVIVGTGVGSDVAKRVAAPLWGGLISLTILTLAVIPAFYVIWRGYQLRRAPPDGAPADGAPPAGPVPGGPAPAEGPLATGAG
jgi:Cu(I)/Ag(I) efflux system membrane protein CusA/SilA